MIFMQVGRDMPLRCLALLFPAYSPAALLPSSPALVAALPYLPPSNHHLARIFNTRAYTWTPTFQTKSRVGEYVNPDGRDVKELLHSLYTVLSLARCGSPPILVQYRRWETSAVCVSLPCAWSERVWMVGRSETKAAVIAGQDWRPRTYHDLGECQRHHSETYVDVGTEGLWL